MNRTCPSAALADNAFGPQVDSCVREFDFTVRFEDTILSILPSILFLLVVPFRIISLKNQRRIIGEIFIQNTKLISVVVYGILQLCLLAFICVRPSLKNPTSIAAATLSFIDSLAICVLSYAEHSKSLRPSALLNVYIFFSFLFDAIRTRTWWLRDSNPAFNAVFTASLAVKSIVLLLESRKKSPLKKGKPKSPEESAGIFSLSLFSWLNHLVIHGFRKVLSMDDLYPIEEGMSATALHGQFWTQWTSSVDLEKGNQKLLFAVAKALKRPLLAPIPARLALIGFKFSQPLLVNRLLNYLSEPKTPESISIGYGIIAAYGIVYIGIAISTGFYWRGTYRSLTMIRGLLASTIYKKTTEISITALDNSASVTLMSADIQRIVDGFRNMHEIWANPIEIGISTYLLSRQMGWACIAPIVISAASGACTMMLSGTAGKRQKEWMVAIEKRVGITASMLSTMKGVKMTGLSNKLGKMIQKLRIDELVSATKFRIIMIWTVVAAFTPTAIAPVATFAIFIGISRSKGEAIDTTKVFTSVSLIALAAPLAQLFQSIPNIVGAFGCFDRIEKFLLAAPRQENRLTTLSLTPGLQPYQSTLPSPRNSGSDEIELTDLVGSAAPVSESSPHMIEKSDIIAVRSGSFGWSQIGPPVLNDIDLSIKSSELTILIGPVASGKSTLLKALLGETLSSKGFVHIPLGLNIGFCDQTPWLINASVKSNIMGISTFDEGWYNTVVNACALRDDINRFPGGDQTMVGSNGITLSGGQKQRLAIARAVYSRKPVIILDDVFSGLDSNTEHHIFSKLLGPGGILRRQKSTVVLATHAVNLLPYADHIIALSGDGKIAEQGTFTQLSVNEGYVKSLEIRQDANQPPPEEEIVDDDVSGSETPETKEPSVAISETEEHNRQTGDMSIYLYYFKSIGTLNSVAFFVIQIIFAFLETFPNVWLSMWTESNAIHPGEHVGYYMGIYALQQVCLLFVILALAWVVLSPIIVRSGNYLHQKMLDTVMAAPMSFFNKTDTGLITNRFSQDVMLIDSELPLALLNFVDSAFLVTAQAAVIAASSKYISIMIPFLILILYSVQKFYLRTSRQLRFMDLEAKSPLYTHFLESLGGLATIRAFGWEKYNKDLNNTLLDASQKPFYLLFMIQRWLTLVLDLTSAAIAVIVVGIAVKLGNSSSAGLTGVALVNLISFNETIKALVLVWTTLETSIGAVSRVRSFTTTTASENLSLETSSPPDSWPQHGTISLSSVSATYKSDAANVFTDLTLEIPPGSKVGICGRSGSGKSSLILALFRMLELSSGSISIDGLDVAHMPREAIRARLNALPQDPYFLSGSVRLNLDPYDDANEERMMEALEKVGLSEKVTEKGGLDVNMDPDFLSHGERQLFCLARAILRPGRIVVLDEVTSNVDRMTDELMQRIIREEFKNHTIIAIAHRLNTILDFDKIAVLDAGRLIEFDSPQALLARDSVFKELYGMYNGKDVEME